MIEKFIEENPQNTSVRLIRSERNTGFSGGHNIGMAAGDAEFYLIFNSDALVRTGALRALLARARAEPDAGLIGCGLEWPNGEKQVSCFRGFSPVSEFIRAAATGPVTRLLRSYEVPLHDIPPPPETVEWVSFASVLLRADACDAAGPMDEGYFLYFEDADYCLAVRRAGWKVVYEPAARVVHLRGGSAPVKTLAAQRKRLPSYYYKSRTRYLRKAWGPLGPLAANLCWLLGRGVALCRGLFSRTGRSGVAHEACDIWINFLDPLRDDRKPHGH